MSARRLQGRSTLRPYRFPLPVLLAPDVSYNAANHSMTRAKQSDTRSIGGAHERFLVGFDGTSLPGELRAMLAQGLAGVAIYRRNWESIEGLRALTQEIRAAAGRPVLIGMDAEPGGQFALPETFTQWPTAAKLGELNDPKVVQRIAHAIGTELRAAGANLNFAPMLDLHAHADSPVTKDRSFGANPQRVGALGCSGSCDGAHLHFEVHPGRNPSGRGIDPMPLLRHWHRLSRR